MRNAFITLALLLSFHLSSAQTFTLKSSELGGQGTEKQALNGFGCKGQNISPQIFWENAPSGTNSFAVTLFDESAPTGSGWWHWVVFDIPGKITELKSGAGNLAMGNAPEGAIQSLTDFKKQGYGGPCPPVGDKAHKYIMTVYALKVDKIGLDETANPALVGFMLEQNVLQKSSIVFYYQR